MTRLLPRLLDHVDLPPAELRAARIDGQVFAVDEAFAVLGEPDSVELRVAALAPLVPDRMIVERSSALWVYGARAEAPFRHQLCMDMANRTTPHHSLRFEYRECRLERGDVLQLGALKITSHLRTAIDLLRTCEPFGAADALDVLAVLQLGGSGVSECARCIRTRPRYPGVRRALARLASIDRSGLSLPFGSQPALTR
jgi:hypothetical protein